MRIFSPLKFAPVDLKEIRTLIDLMKRNGLSVFKMEREGFKITLKRGNAEGVPAQIIAMQPAPPPSTQSSPRTASSNEEPAPEVSHHQEIKSPMVGTFYSASSPDAPAYVTVGQEITPDSVVCIIEAMKVMNEIKAEISGVVIEVCAENGKPVQFGQTLFRVK
ncbi:MAG TPA: acetyl-CoA carboxylase biotin carboxyl carrier protein [Terrimicrobiaceae bacterium]